MMAAEFQGLSADEAREFAARWLPAWSGNDPERLATFYADDAFYSYPAIPNGVGGKQELLRYFTVLLSRFPDWEWTNVDALPLEGGFLNTWRAQNPSRGPRGYLRGRMHRRAPRRPDRPQLRLLRPLRAARRDRRGREPRRVALGPRQGVLVRASLAHYFAEPRYPFCLFELAALDQRRGAAV